MNKLFALLLLIPTLAFAQSADRAIAAQAGYPDVANSPAAVATSVASALTATDVPPYQYVRIFCTVVTHFRITTSAGSAALTDPLLPAGAANFFNVGAYKRVAFILDSGAGSCSVTLMR